MKDANQTNLSWNLTTGELCDYDPQSAILIREWAVGLMDASGQFQQLLEIRLPPKT